MLFYDDDNEIVLGWVECVLNMAYQLPIEEKYDQEYGRFYFNSE